MSKDGKPNRAKIKTVDTATLPPLPKGWCWETIGDLAAPEPNSITDGPFGSNLKTSHYTDSGPRVIRLQNIGDGVFLDERAHISQDHFDSLGKHHVFAGDLVIAALGETLPKSCMIPPWVGPALVKADCPRFKPDTGLILSQYANYALNSPGTRARATAIIHGVGRPRLNLAEIRGIWIPLAPPAEQLRIVAKIEELFSDLDAGVAALKRVQANLKRYRAAVLKAAVEGRLTAEWRKENRPKQTGPQLLARILGERRHKWEEEQLAAFAKAGKSPPGKWKDRYKEPTGPDYTHLPALPEGWCWATVDQLIRYLRNGLSQKPSQVPPGHRILRINAVRPMSVDLREIRYYDKPENDVADYFIEQGDLLFTRYNGSVDLLGVSGMVRHCTERTLHPDKLIRVKAVIGRPLPEYLEIATNVGESRNHMQRRARTTAGQTGISAVDVRETPVPLCSLAEQETIVAEVERRLSIMQEAHSQVQADMKRSSSLRQSILKRAFEGKLVPQNPSDEPASVLLQRLKDLGASTGSRQKAEALNRRARTKSNSVRTGDGRQPRESPR